MKRCGSHTCKSPADARVHWPGKPLDLCFVCSHRASQIAEAMGFALDITPLNVAVGMFSREPNPCTDPN